MEIAPQLVVTIDSMVKALFTSNWQRVALAEGDAMRIMKRRPSQTRRELLIWLLDTVGIYPQGQGGNYRADDMLAVSYEIDNLNSGAQLKLTTNEILDNQMARDERIGAMDYAQKWARDRGSESAIIPRRVLFGGGGTTGLIQLGTTVKGYDGVPFFATNHPVVPGTTGGTTYSNIITGVGIGAAPTGGTGDISQQDALQLSAINLASALGSISRQVFGSFGNTVQRFLRPKIIVAPTALQYVVNQLVGGGGLFTSGPAADILAQTTNVFGNWQFDKPIIAPELDALSSTTYYIGVEDILSDELGAFIFSEREPYSMRGYPDTASAAQNTAREWIWNLDGRNAGAYGHPYMFYQCTT